MTQYLRLVLDALVALIHAGISKLSIMGNDLLFQKSQIPLINIPTIALSLSRQHHKIGGVSYTVHSARRVVLLYSEWRE